MDEIYIATAREAALAAGALLRDHFGAMQDVTQKRGQDLLTEHDVAAERIILEILRRRFPDHRILAEESGEVGAPGGTYCWIVDPLDGTQNYAHGVPHFDVSLSLIDGDDVLLGVTYAPIAHELLWAAKGCGAFLGDRPIHVSETADLADAVVTTSLPSDWRRARRLLHFHTRLIGRSLSQRRAGAAALDMAYVAAGRFDAMTHPEIQPWDVSAGLALVREAGGKITDFYGGDVSPHAGSVVASNGHIHEALLRALHEPWEDE
ncbi:MAG: inositol monophosphatase [Acidobacteria bacterium]|nr:inositol monophosphatase [Acidobacteriota bacterium]